MPSALEISVNGEVRRVEAGASVANLLASLSLEGRKVAVAVNRSVVARGNYPNLTLQPGDRVEILEAVGGG
ncbi:MAG: sulfur carrier protein ThiS [Myxococcales bacterium]|jgi:sulfur carrier protein|nr:sulfur carrier protein ThiS [Myxococcales bacterium]